MQELCILILSNYNMRKYLILSLLTFTLSLTAKSYSPLFPITAKNMGTIKKGTEQITVEFDIMNNTDKVISITNVHASCGCMNVDYPKHPIKRHDSGKIKVTISLNNQHGFFKKSVLIYATNTKPTILKITGKVL